MKDVRKEDLYKEGLVREREGLSTSCFSILSRQASPSIMNTWTSTYTPAFPTHRASSSPPLSSSFTFSSASSYYSSPPSSSSSCSMRATLPSLVNLPVSTPGSTRPSTAHDMEEGTETRETLFFPLLFLRLSHLHHQHHHRLSILQPSPEEKEKKNGEGSCLSFFFVWASEARPPPFYDSRASDRTSYRVSVSSPELSQLNCDSSREGLLSHVFFFRFSPCRDSMEVEEAENRFLLCRSFKRQGRAKKTDKQRSGDEAGEKDEKEKLSLLSLPLLQVVWMEREDGYVHFLSRHTSPSSLSSFVCRSRQDLPVFSPPLYQPLLLQIPSPSLSFKSFSQPGRGRVRIDKDRMRGDKREEDATESAGRRKRRWRRPGAFEISIQHASFSDSHSSSTLSLFPSPSSCFSSSSSSSSELSQVSSSVKLTESPWHYLPTHATRAVPFSSSQVFWKLRSSSRQLLLSPPVFSSTLASRSHPLSRCSYPSSSSSSSHICSSRATSLSQGSNSFSSSSSRLRYRSRFSDRATDCCSAAPSRFPRQTSRQLERRAFLLSPSLSSPTSSSSCFSSSPSSSSSFSSSVYLLSPSSSSASSSSSSPSSCVFGEDGVFREGAVVSLRNFCQPPLHYKCKGVEEEEEAMIFLASSRRLRISSHTGGLEEKRFSSTTSHTGRSLYDLQKKNFQKKCEKGDITENRKASGLRRNLSRVQKIRHTRPTRNESPLALLSFFFSFFSQLSLLSFPCLYRSSQRSLSSSSSSSLCCLSGLSLIPLFLSLLAFSFFVVILISLPSLFLVVMVRSFFFSSKSFFFSLFISPSCSLPLQLLSREDSSTSVTNRLLQKGDRTLSLLQRMSRTLLQTAFSSWIRRKEGRSSASLLSSSPWLLRSHEQGKEVHRLLRSRRKEGKLCCENASVPSSSFSVSSSLFTCLSSSSPSSSCLSSFETSFSPRKEEGNFFAFSGFHHSFFLSKRRSSLRRVSSSILVLSSFLLVLLLPSSSSSFSSSSLSVFLPLSFIPSFFSFFSPPSSSSFSSLFHITSLPSPVLLVAAQQHQQQTSQGMYFNPSHPAQLSSSSSLPYQQMVANSPFNPTPMSFSPSQGHPPVRGEGASSSSSSPSYAVGLSPMQQLQVLQQPRQYPTAQASPPSSPQLLSQQQQSMILGAIAQQQQSSPSPSLSPSPTSMALPSQALSSSSFSQLNPDIQRELLRLLLLQQQLQQQQQQQQQYQAQLAQQAFSGAGGERGSESLFPSPQGFPHQMEGRGGQAGGGNGSPGSGSQVYVHPTGGGVGNAGYFLQHAQTPNNFLLSQPTQETPETFLRGGYIPTSPLVLPQQTLNYASPPSSSSPSLPQTGRQDSPLSSVSSSQNSSGVNLQLSGEQRLHHHLQQPAGQANQQAISSSSSATSSSSFSPSTSSYLNVLGQSGNVNAFHDRQPSSYQAQNTSYNYPSLPGAVSSSSSSSTGAQHQLGPPPSLQDLSLSLPHLLSLLQTGGEGTGEGREEGEAERYQKMMKGERLRHDAPKGLASGIGGGGGGLGGGGGESSSVLFNTVVKAILDDLAAGRTGTVEKLAEVLLQPLPENQRQQIYSVLLQRLSEKAAASHPPSLDLGSLSSSPPPGLPTGAGERGEGEGRRKRREGDGNDKKREGEEGGGGQHQYEGGNGRLKVLSAASSSSDLTAPTFSSNHILGGFSSPSSSAVPLQPSSHRLPSSHGSSSFSSSDLSERISQCLALPSCQAIEGDRRPSREKESSSQRNEDHHEGKSSSSSSRRTKKNSSSSSQQEDAPYLDLFPSTWEPRCASDGNTYANACVFDVEACVRSVTGQEPLVQLHEGSCRSSPSTPPPPLPRNTDTLHTSSSSSSLPSASSSSFPEDSSSGRSSTVSSSSSPPPPSVASKQTKPHGQLKKIGSGEGDPSSSSSSLLSSSASSSLLSRSSPSSSLPQGVSASSDEKTRKKGEEKSRKEEQGGGSTPQAKESSTTIGAPQQKAEEEKEEEEKKNKDKKNSSPLLKEVNSGSTSPLASREESPSTQKNTPSSFFPPTSSSSSKDKGEEASSSSISKREKNLSPPAKTTSTSTSTPGGTSQSSSSILSKSRNSSSPSPSSASSPSGISPVSSSSPPVAHANAPSTPLHRTGLVEQGERREERKDRSNPSLVHHNDNPQKGEIPLVPGMTTRGETNSVGSERGEARLHPFQEENPLGEARSGKSVSTNASTKQESIGEALVNRFAALMRGDRVPGDGAAVQLAVAEAEKLAAEKERKKREKLEKMEEKMRKKKKQRQQEEEEAEGRDGGGEEGQAREGEQEEEEDFLLDDEEEDDEETSLSGEEDDSGEAKLERLKKEMATNPQRASIEKLMKKREAVQHLQELQQLQLQLLQQQAQPGAREAAGQPIDPRLYPSLVLPLPTNEVDPGIPSQRSPSPPSSSSSFLNEKLAAFNATSSSPPPRQTDPRSFLWSAHNVTTIQQLMEERTKVKLHELLLQSQPQAGGESGRGEKNPMAEKAGGLGTTLEGQGQPGGGKGGGRESQGGVTLQTSGLHSSPSPSPSLSYPGNNPSPPFPPSTSSSSSPHPYLSQSSQSVPGQALYRTSTAAASSPSFHQSGPSLSPSSPSLSPSPSSPGFLQQNSMYSSSSPPPPAVPPPQHPYSLPSSHSSQQASLNTSNSLPQMHATNPGLSLSPSLSSPSSLPYPYAAPQGAGRGSAGGEFQQHAQSLPSYSSPPAMGARPMNSMGGAQPQGASQMYTNTDRGGEGGGGGGAGAPRPLGGSPQTSLPPSFDHPREGVLPSSPSSPLSSSSSSSSGPGMFLYGQQQQPLHQGSPVPSPRASPPFTPSSSSSSQLPSVSPSSSSYHHHHPYPSYSLSPSSSSHQPRSFSSPSSYGLVNTPQYYAYPSTQSPSSLPPQSSPPTPLSHTDVHPGGRLSPSSPAALPPPSRPSSFPPAFPDSRAAPLHAHPTNPSHLLLSPGVGGTQSFSSLSTSPQQPYDIGRESSSPQDRSEGRTPSSSSSSRDRDISTTGHHHYPKKDSETKSLLAEKKKSPSPVTDIPSHPPPTNSVKSDPSASPPPSSSSSPFSPPPQCNFLCPAGGPVVCGTDNQTYTNECEARVYACLKRDASLTVKHKGPCKRLHSNTSNSNSNSSSSNQPHTTATYDQSLHTTAGNRYPGRREASSSSSMREGRSGARLETNGDQGDVDGENEEEEVDEEEGKRKKKKNTSTSSNGRSKKKEKGGKALSEEDGEENEGVFESDDGTDDEKLRTPRTNSLKVKKVKREREEEEEKSDFVKGGAGETVRRKDEKEGLQQRDRSPPLHENNLQRDTKKTSISSSSSSRKSGSNSVADSQAPPLPNSKKPLSLDNKERDEEENEDGNDSSSSSVSLTLEGITQTIPKYRHEARKIPEEEDEEEEETFLRNHSKKNLPYPSSSPTPLSFLPPSSSSSTPSLGQDLSFQLAKRGTPDEMRRGEKQRGTDKEEGDQQEGEEKAFRISANSYNDDEDEDRKSFLRPTGRRGGGGGGEGTGSEGSTQRKRKSLLLTENEEEKRHGNLLDKDYQRQGEEKEEEEGHHRKNVNSQSLHSHLSDAHRPLGEGETSTRRRDDLTIPTSPLLSNTTEKKASPFEKAKTGDLGREAYSYSSEEEEMKQKSYQERKSEEERRKKDDRKTSHLKGSGGGKEVVVDYLADLARLREMIDSDDFGEEEEEDYEEDDGALDKEERKREGEEDEEDDGVITDEPYIYDGSEIAKDDYTALSGRSPRTSHSSDISGESELRDNYLNQRRYPVEEKRKDTSSSSSLSLSLPPSSTKSDKTSAVRSSTPSAASGGRAQSETHETLSASSSFSQPPMLSGMSATSPGVEKSNLGGESVSGSSSLSPSSPPSLLDFFKGWF